jgi:4-amino-4-deoxy-L-arabinose transferase-like glycosyltransferase
MPLISRIRTSLVATRWPIPLSGLAVTVIVLVYLGLAVYLSRVLNTWDDETAYVALGRLAATGAISLFQDDMTGQRMPLPFYVEGASQVIFGRNLWAARLLSVGIGIGALVLTVDIARRLGGDLAGALAGLLLATQGVVVGYYATATYHALTATIVMAAVWVLIREELPARHALGMAVASVLFFTRTNMFPALPFFFAWALLGAGGAFERLMVVVVAAVPPAIFFFSDPTHLKLLAHVPVLNHLVTSLDYRSILSFSAVNHAGFGQQLWAFVVIARRYESWTLAAAGLALVGALLRVHGRPLASVPFRRGVTVVAFLWVWLFVWHLVIWRISFRYVLPFVAAFAPLAAVVFGVVFATVLARDDLPRAARTVLALTLAGALTLSVVFIRHPVLASPVPRPFDRDPIQLLDRVAVDLRTLVPTGEKVFLFGPPMAPYLAGLDAPLQQLMSPGGTLAPAHADDRLISKNGVWGSKELEHWLGRDLQYAVISPVALQGIESLRPEAVNRIRELLRERFMLVGQVGEGPLLGLDVYRRTDKRTTE